MFSASQFLNIIKSASAKVSREEFAKHSIPKRELYFRNLVLRYLEDFFPEIIVSKEWKLPKHAFEQWVGQLPKGAKTKTRGQIDLVGSPRLDETATSPHFGVEFKFWYWFDALNDGKYKLENIDYWHSIPLSFSVDEQKLLAAIPASPGASLIVTVIPTFRFDLIPQDTMTSRGDFLIERGFAKSYVELSKVNDKEQPHTSDELRTMALGKFSKYFRNAGYPTVVGGEITSEYRGLHVTTDFVVSELSTLR